MATNRELVGTALVIAVGLLLPWALDSFWLSVASFTLMWVYFAYAWNLVGGVAGQLSLGHSIYLGIGAYCSIFLFSEYGVSPFVSMLVAVPISALVGAGVAYASVRQRLSHLSYALVTIALASAVLFAVRGSDLLGGTNGLFATIEPSLLNLQFSDPKVMYYIGVALVMLAVVLTWYLPKTRAGVYLVTIRENDHAAEAIGVNTKAYKVLASAASGGFSAVAGIYYAQLVLFVDPGSVFGVNINIQVILFTVVGGAGTVLGPLVGPALLYPLGEWFRTTVGGTIPGIHVLFYGVVLILVLLRFPRGIVGGLRGRLTPRPVAKVGQPGAPATAHSPAQLITPPGEGNPGPTAPGRVILRLEDLHKSFGGVTATKGVSFEVKEGEVLGLIGPNGAGKSTLFELISGFQPLDTGAITFGGKRIDGKSPHAICELGLVRTFQITESFPEMSPREVLRAAALLREDGLAAAERRAGELLEELQLSTQADVDGTSLTVAQRKRLEVGKALATRPKLVLLDEVMAGLTAVEAQEVMKVVRAYRDRGMTFLITEHVMHVVMGLSDRIVVLNYGEVIASGSPEEVANNSSVIEAYLGSESSA